VAAEAEVVVAQRPVGVVEVSVVLDDAVVVASVAAGAVSQVVAEAAERRIVLLEDDCLCLDLADLLRDNLLCHLLEDGQALLDDYHLLRVANKLAVLLDHNLVEAAGVGEIVRAIEVVEVVKGRDAAPVVEGLAASSDGVGLVGGGRRHASGESDGNEESGEFSEHDDCVLERMCSDCVKKVRPTGRVPTKRAENLVNMMIVCWRGCVQTASRK